MERFTIDNKAFEAVTKILGQEPEGFQFSKARSRSLLKKDRLSITGTYITTKKLDKLPEVDASVTHPDPMGSILFTLVLFLSRLDPNQIPKFSVF